jgi:hypothetical protein
MLSFLSRRVLLFSIARTFLVACALVELSVALALPPATPEYTLKAAFIYNFARFTNWPDRPDNLLHLCVLGHDPFGNVLDTIDKKEIGQLQIAVTRLRDADQAMRACQIVFVADSEVDSFLMQPERVRLAGGVLTIAEREGAARQGIIIELTTDERKIGFEFNRASAREAKLDISSKLLRLARRVH